MAKKMRFPKIRNLYLFLLMIFEEHRHLLYFKTKYTEQQSPTKNILNYN